MQLKNKILLIASGITSFFATLFGFLFLHQKNKNLKEKTEQLQCENDLNKEVLSRYAAAKKENEELLQSATSGNSIESFNTGIELLQKYKSKHNSNS